MILWPLGICASCWQLFCGGIPQQGTQRSGAAREWSEWYQAEKIFSAPVTVLLSDSICVSGVFSAVALAAVRG